ncbi:TetR/AcrR family transcriptional regulator [Nocardia sp. NBC_00565]|uniref:TetR/AcrR family transcriptional regulator n=1 Tax=Nocardia sp. NBC_00565 TaxID=2975993 RepID=UPI002E7FEFE4|nr:helix-turn-helix domain-containing protein [Nocardia sp. NBC_00565]WUC05729.1 TetR/AcrR family transcriptional regulator [Nocardia sp. NBC_00565]
MNSRTDAAVGRALAARRQEAVDEVEAILAAAVEVMERDAPAPPRVSDIIAAAGSSNKAFYRYFSGKDDLILAVMERGVGLVATYLDHRMSQVDEPARRVAVWIEGMLAQVADPDLIRASRAVTVQLAAITDRGIADAEIARPLRDRLSGSVAALGCADPERDTDAVFIAVLGLMRRCLARNVKPDVADINHFVSFCLRGLDVARSRNV